ncbi:hypothetical protein L7F22_062382 [Adiantum nelumboides]|nr:hypothetical protein [Adiantum nelumboides]
MARKKIREYDSKRILKEHLQRLAGIVLHIQSAQITQSTNFDELLEREPWLSTTKLVVKPDMLFGKRGKSGLVALNLDLTGVMAFVGDRLGKEVEMGGIKAPITTFILEPFVPHDEEYYFSITSERLGASICFSDCGGMEIEENWDKVKQVFIPADQALNTELCAPLIATLPLEKRCRIESFIKGVISVFEDLNFTFLEMNPFTIVNGEPYPLDMHGELDDTAAFKNFKKWCNVEFPLPFGRVMSPAEKLVYAMDEKTSASLKLAILNPLGRIWTMVAVFFMFQTSASLKLAILNPLGRIWTMVAGGGASVIYADTLGDLGYAGDLGNYAEYSGAPKEEEILRYARVLIDSATANCDGKGRALIVGGGIANFTDVSATFGGIIRAMREKQKEMRDGKMGVFVRRGGPNWQQGLARMRALSDEISVPVQVYGPEASMTGICKEAIDYIKVSG